MRLALVLLLAICFGCSKRLEEVAISPDFEPEQQEAIVTAVEEWFSAIPEARVPVFIGESRGKGSIVVASDPNEEPCKDSPADTHLTTTEGPNIRLCLGKIRPEIFRLVVLHEMGHAIRARDGHLPEDGYLMSTATPQSVEGISSKDILYVRRGL